MAKEIKLTQEEIAQIKEVQSTANTLRSDLGTVELQLHSVNVKKTNIMKAFEDLQTTEENLLKVITEKYGDGTVDLNTGIFTPVGR